MNEIILGTTLAGVWEGVKIWFNCGGQWEGKIG